MAVDARNPLTRRALLAAGLGAMAATVASAIGRPAAAADGDPVVLGEVNRATSETRITSDSTSGHALVVRNRRGIPVLGTTTSGDYGLWGINDRDDGIGVRGEGWVAVAGRCSRPGGVGVSGSGEWEDSTGVLGSGRRAGVAGRSIRVGTDEYEGHGVHGESGSATEAGVFGLGRAVGVHGKSTESVGVRGESTSAAGVRGDSESSMGVRGVSTSGHGVRGESESSIGVRGRSVSGVGVHGLSMEDRGGTFETRSVTAQVRLVPSYADKPPSNGQPGDLFVDRQGRLWFWQMDKGWVNLIADR